VQPNATMRIASRNFRRLHTGLETHALEDRLPRDEASFRGARMGFQVIAARTANKRDRDRRT